MEETNVTQDTSGTETSGFSHGSKSDKTNTLFIQTSKENIFKPIQAVSGVVQKKQPLPVLSNILFSQKGKHVTMIANDLDIQILTVAEVGVEDADISTTISARKLNDILAALPDTNTVTFSTKGDHVVLSSGKSKFELQTISAADFPVMGEMELQHAFTMTCLRFKYLLNMVSFACAVNNVRYFLNGVYLCSENKKVRGVATDGHRLALCDAEAEETNEEKLDAIIPRKTVKELTRLIPDTQDPIEVFMSEKQIKFKFGGIEILSKLVEGRYPDYLRVIPEHNDKEFRVGRQELLSSLQRVAILTADKLKGVRWNLMPGVLNVAATNADMEEAEDEINVEYSGSPIEIGFNVTYLIEVLNVLKNDTVRISLGEQKNPALVRMPDNENFKFVVMPMKI